MSGKTLTLQRKEPTNGAKRTQITVQRVRRKPISIDEAAALFETPEIPDLGDAVRAANSERMIAALEQHVGKPAKRPTGLPKAPQAVTYYEDKDEWQHIVIPGGKRDVHLHEMLDKDKFLLNVNGARLDHDQIVALADELQHYLTHGFLKENANVERSSKPCKETAPVPADPPVYH
jgi:hypothetical protein